MTGLTRVTAALLAGVLTCSPALAQRPNYGSDLPLRSLDPAAVAIGTSVKAFYARSSYDTDYSKLRSLILSHGWKPVVVKQCLANMVGGSAKEDCASDPTNEACHTCDTYPELEGCKGDRYCLMQFSSPASKFILKASTFGYIASEPGVGVTSWGFDTSAEKD